MWDIRTGDVVQRYSVGNGGQIAPSCCDINCSDQVICVGSNLVNNVDDKDAIVALWDVRATEPSAVITEAHSDDVTEVRFHPARGNVFATGSTDGLVNICDMAQLPDEDEVILHTLNSDSSMARLGFFGPEGEYLYGLTHVESYFIWHAFPQDDSEDSEVIVEIPDLRERLSAQGIPADYCIDSMYDQHSQRLYLLAGTNTGDVNVLHVNKDGLALAATLHGGHNAIVRSMLWGQNAGDDTFVSAGEDARLCLWTPTAVQSTPAAPATGKMPASHSKTSSARAKASPY
eukprot:m.1020316 g.1020316  ORF g.1020316 m.1020316 type:complete len:288 (-) comp24087_c0_seq79:353-1216(-)